MSYFIMAWTSMGMAFWFGCILHDGLPNSWKSKPRETGVAEMVFFYAPLCAIGGPLWWAIYVYFRHRDGAR